MNVSVKVLYTQCQDNSNFWDFPLCIMIEFTSYNLYKLKEQKDANIPQILQVFNTGVGTWEHFHATSFSAFLWAQRQRGRRYGACHKCICVKRNPGEIRHWYLGGEDASCWENCWCQTARYGILAIKSKVVFLKLYPLVVPFLLDLEYSCRFKWLHTWQFLTAERDLVAWETSSICFFLSPVAWALPRWGEWPASVSGYQACQHTATVPDKSITKQQTETVQVMAPVPFPSCQSTWQQTLSLEGLVSLLTLSVLILCGCASWNSLTYWDPNRKILCSANELWNAWAWVLYHISCQ